MIRTLTHDDFESLYAAFLAAFSDYVVKLSPTRDQLREMFTRRAWVPSLSVGAFDGDRMVAFTVNCVDHDVAYDSGTGVVPTHRRRGLARAVMQKSFEALSGCETYLLEVIDSNAPALELYRALGFRETRGLQCWTHASPRAAEPPLQSAAVRPEFRDVEPSWQNSDRSIERAQERHIVLGNDDSYAVLFPDSGDLAQLAVRREARRRGLGTRLLDQAATMAGKPLRILNVDEKDAGIAAFLERAGAQKLVRQIEMVRRLR